MTDFITEMEISLGIEIEKTINTVLDDIEGHINRMLAAGMSEEQIKLNILNDLKNRGRTFSPFANNLKHVVSNSVNKASNDGSNEVFLSAGVKEFRWITVSKNPCQDCVARHGKVRTYKEWKELGLPGSGFSVCRRNCKCRLVPDEYEGDGLENPVILNPKYRLKEYARPISLRKMTTTWEKLEDEIATIDRSMKGTGEIISVIQDSRDTRAFFVRDRNGNIIAGMSIGNKDRMIELRHIGSNKKGAGRILLRKLVSIAKREGKKIYLEARMGVRGYWAQRGFELQEGTANIFVGDPYKIIL